MSFWGTVGGVASALIPGVGSLVGQSQANQANLKIAREQMAFQERMSNTSYQRAVQDMKASGINPMLAYQQGGASSPGGASAHMENAIGPAVSSAMHGIRLRKEMKLLDAQIDKENAQTVDTLQSAEGKWLMNQAALWSPDKSVAQFAGTGAEMRSQSQVIRERMQQLENARREGDYRLASRLETEVRTLVERQKEQLGRWDVRYKEAGYPRATWEGSRAAAYLDQAFGQGGVVGGITRPIATAVGLSRVGAAARGLGKVAEKARRFPIPPMKWTKPRWKK